MDHLIGQSHIIVLILLFCLALFLLSRSADFFIDQAVLFSRSFGIPEFMIGATIVSLGTTLPEAASSLAAVGQGVSNLAVGNALGSIVTNTSLVLGMGACLGKLPVSKIVSKRFLFLCGCTGMLYLFSLFPHFSIAKAHLPRWFGVLLLILLVAYTFFSFQKTGKNGNQNKKSPLGWKATLLLFLKMAVSAVVIAMSASVLIDCVVEGASRLGVSQTLISATVVALGTSLPELTTTAMAAKRGHGGLAVGNVMGANILNILLVLGISITASPGGIALSGTFFIVQLPVLAVILLLFGFFIYDTKRHEISKKEGVSLLVVYLLYLLLSFVFSNS